MSSRRKILLWITAAGGLLVVAFIALSIQAGGFNKMFHRLSGSSYTIKTVVSFEADNSGDLPNENYIARILSDRMSFMGYDMELTKQHDHSWLIVCDHVADTNAARKLISSNARFACWEVIELSQAEESIKMAEKALTKQPGTSNVGLPSDIKGLLHKDARESPEKRGIMPFINPVALQSGQPAAEFFLVKEEDTARLNVLLRSKIVLDVFPKESMFVYGQRQRIGNTPAYFFVYLLRKPIEGPTINDAMISSVDIHSGKYPAVVVGFNKTGAARWARMTGNSTEHFIAMTIDREVYEAPRVMGPIMGGLTQISMSDEREGQLLAAILKFGPLKATPVLHSFTVIK